MRRVAGVSAARADVDDDLPDRPPVGHPAERGRPLDQRWRSPWTPPARRPRAWRRAPPRRLRHPGRGDIGAADGAGVRRALLDRPGTRSPSWSGSGSSAVPGGPVDELLGVAVEGVALEQLQVEVGGPGEDRGGPGPPADDREDGQLDPVD